MGSAGAAETLDTFLQKLLQELELAALHCSVARPRQFRHRIDTLDRCGSTVSAEDAGRVHEALRDIQWCRAKVRFQACRSYLILLVVLRLQVPRL